MGWKICKKLKEVRVKGLRDSLKRRTASGSSSSAVILAIDDPSK